MILSDQELEQHARAYFNHDELFRMRTRFDCFVMARMNYDESGVERDEDGEPIERVRVDRVEFVAFDNRLISSARSRVS